MSLITSIGTVVRTLPMENGLEVKLRRQADESALIVDVPANQPALMDLARAARVGGGTVRVQHTASGRCIAIGRADLAAAV